MSASRLWIAMGSYAVLAVLATLTLDRAPRGLVLLILGALAVKTWIAWSRRAD